MSQGIAANPELETLRKQRIGLAHKGRKKSPEQVAKMSANGKKLIGKNNPNWKGKLKSHICIQCGVKFLGNYGNPKKNKGLNKYCSRPCMNLYHRTHRVGNNHPRWKSGEYSHGNRHYKYGHKHIQWRKFVLERDNYICVLCRGENNEPELHVDHIVPFKDNKELRYDVLNGRTLCKWCHYEITFGKSPLNNWKAYSRWAKVTKGKLSKDIAAVETKRGDSVSSTDAIVRATEETR